jgi:hypothetical protein
VLFLETFVFKNCEHFIVSSLHNYSTFSLRKIYNRKPWFPYYRINSANVKSFLCVYAGVRGNK